MNLHRLLSAPEKATGLDKPADTIAAAVGRLVGDGRAADWLRGSWLGHPLHPILVTVPIGAWTSAAALRAAGRTDEARRLLLIGLLAFPPAAALGWADFKDLDAPQRRVGLVHALTNAAAALLISAAWRARDDRTATALGAAGLATAGAGGALGGHLAYALGAGVHRWQSAATAPAFPATPVPLG
ncbi:MAG TPA: DUF2231 domain-containing protein [Nocardia sp.]|uniref:DUF2231 domain-containing protein n=1 Tax=Nocardia TaxID=1817 RepID=UPI00245604DA|nr:MULTISPECIES: DUF2231 domain-containing protein [Nocardia]HLS78533.1 DUF2231 domain-containing protein [Nocardia sp.]